MFVLCPYVFHSFAVYDANYSAGERMGKFPLVDGKEMPY